MNVFSKKIRIIDKFDDAEDYVLWRFCIKEIQWKK
jgi:hypothetical protein